MNNSLKEIRINALQYNIEDMASKLNMSISEYRKIEEQPLELNTLVKLSQALGLEIDYLLNKQKEELNFHIENSWSTINSFIDQFSEFTDKTTEFIENLGDDQFKKEVADLTTSIKTMLRKPRVAFVGRSDVGKSTLINNLIGNKTLPEAWTPTTSIIIYVKHINDRPSYCKDNVMIFHSDLNKDLWDDTRLEDKEYTKSYCITSGDYDLLHDFGARQGSKFQNTDATSAIVFIDSEILQNCDLLDLPGYGTKDREEDDSLLRKLKNVDVLIYLSLANGFLRGEDIQWLQNELPNIAPITLNNKDINPLGNLFIVASQAHTVENGSLNSLNKILDEGCKRFKATLSDNYWINMGQVVSDHTFRKRLFTYSCDQSSLRNDFENDLRQLLEILPKIIIEKTTCFFRERINSTTKETEKKINSILEIIQQRESKKNFLKMIQDAEPERKYNNALKKKEICLLINEYKADVDLKFINRYNQIITKDNIISLIKKYKWEKKDEDMKALSSKLSNLLNDEYATITREYSEKFKIIVDEYLDDFEFNTKISTIENNIKGEAGFNFKGSFAGGLAGATTYGALAIWASSLGNLGAYILVAKGVSILAALGISVGGTAAATSAIAAIGGPIVIAVGIAALIGLAFYLLFTGGWKASVAKKIVTEYDKKEVLSAYKNNIDIFWKDTISAFEKCATQMETEYEAFLENLKKEILETSEDELMNKINIEKKKQEFYKEWKKIANYKLNAYELTTI